VLLHRRAARLKRFAYAVIRQCAALKSVFLKGSRGGIIFFGELSFAATR
jgi:hypothetical protein